jgi:hypothetical protein
MAHDALEPGPNGDFPWFPRHSQTGEPLWSDKPETDGKPVPGDAYGQAPIPRGARWQHGVKIDLTPTVSIPGVGIVVVDPPTIPPVG